MGRLEESGRESKNELEIRKRKISGKLREIYKIRGEEGREEHERKK